MTATRLTLAGALSDLESGELVVPSARQNLTSDTADPLVSSKGAGSVHALRRRCGKGWRYLGYAVWSCRRQSWVCGSWSRPVDFATAEAALRNMPWEG